jgi:hypothetical protein
MRADRVQALERADVATAANETAQVASSEAYDARDRALEAHRETAASMNLVEQEVMRLKGEVDVKSSLLEDLDAVIPELQKRVDAAQATAAKAVAQKESAIRRANELERLLADKAGEADDLRSAAIAAESRMRDAMGRVKGLEDDLAGSHARVSALESTEIALEAQAVRLAAEASEASQAAAAGEAELLTLKDELSKRPPIDIIKQLDIENLMQRNVQVRAHRALLGRCTNLTPSPPPRRPPPPCSSCWRGARRTRRTPAPTCTRCEGRPMPLRHGRGSPRRQPLRPCILGSYSAASEVPLPHQGAPGGTASPISRRRSAAALKPPAAACFNSATSCGTPWSSRYRPPRLYCAPAWP